MGNLWFPLPGKGVLVVHGRLPGTVCRKGTVTQAGPGCHMGPATAVPRLGVGSQSHLTASGRQTTDLLELSINEVQVWS